MDVCVQNGRLQLCQFIRNKDTRVCPVRANATLIWYKYVRGGFSFKNPVENWGDWWVFGVPASLTVVTTVLGLNNLLHLTCRLATVFYTRHKDGTAVSYGTLHKHIRQVFTALGIFIAKVCHAFRHGGSKWLDAAG
jgi:hypothetical protein